MLILVLYYAMDTNNELTYKGRTSEAKHIARYDIAPDKRFLRGRMWTPSGDPSDRRP